MAQWTRRPIRLWAVATLLVTPILWAPTPVAQAREAPQAIRGVPATSAVTPLDGGDGEDDGEWWFRFIVQNVWIGAIGEKSYSSGLTIPLQSMVVTTMINGKSIPIQVVGREHDGFFGGYDFANLKQDLYVGGPGTTPTSGDGESFLKHFDGNVKDVIAFSVKGTYSVTYKP